MGPERHRSTARPPAFLAPGECQVWWARADGLEATSAERLLDGEERDRLTRFRRPDDGARFAVGRALTRLVLARATGAAPGEVEIDRTCAGCGRPHGRPRLVRPAAALDVSTSHAGRRVAVAVAAGARVGIDVEALRPDLGVEEIARTALTDDELARLHRVPDGPERARALLVLWTRKEAVLKALGTGLATSPTEVVVSGPDEPPAVLAGAPPGLSLHEVAAGPGYVATLALLGPAGRVVAYDGTALLGGFDEMCTEPSGRAERRDAASSVAPVLANTGAPCVLASHHPAHPDNEAHFAKPSSAAASWRMPTSPRRARRSGPSRER